MIKVQIYYLFIIISHLITGAKVLLFSPNTKNGLALICKNLLTRRSFVLISLTRSFALGETYFCIFEVIELSPKINDSYDNYSYDSFQKPKFSILYRKYIIY